MPKPLLPTRRFRFRRYAFELVDLLAAAVTAALRRGDEMGDAITARGVIADWREPDVIRVAPVPLYNTFKDAEDFAKILRECL